MKTQIVLPDALAQGLKSAIPVRKRSQFIAEAIEAKLRALKFRQALKTAAGCWSDKNHPQLKNQNDINRYLARFRKRFHRNG